MQVAHVALKGFLKSLKIEHQLQLRAAVTQAVDNMKDFMHKAPGTDIQIH
jgi:hypothetical protein